MNVDMFVYDGNFAAYSEAYIGHPDVEEDFWVLELMHRGNKIKMFVRDEKELKKLRYATTTLIEEIEEYRKETDTNTEKQKQTDIDEEVTSAS